jgi:predicted metal-dependent enzyme (double-stranded beta helix superfamily)
MLATAHNPGASSMDGCNTKWLDSVVGAIRRYRSGGRATLEDLKAELSHLAWSDLAPTARTLPGDKDRFRRHPLAGTREIGCSALVMYWPPGHATLPHDHGGLWGIEVVLDGALHVEEYRSSGTDDAPTLAKERSLYLGIGDAAAFESPCYVHRCRNLSNATPTLTLHVYGGLLERYVAFDDAAGTLRIEPRVAVSDAPLD